MRLPLIGYVDANRLEALERTAFIVFMRVVSILLIFAGMQYWSSIVGYVADESEALWMLSAPRQVVTVFYAVLLPVAGVGMWFGSSWGIGLLFISLAIQFVLEFGFTDDFPSQWPAIIMHLVIIGIYAAFRILNRWQS